MRRQRDFEVNRVLQRTEEGRRLVRPCHPTALSLHRVPKVTEILVFGCLQNDAKQCWKPAKRDCGG